MNTLEKKVNYQILMRGAYSDYVLINRNTSYCPYVVCYGFNDEDYTWAQGHYYESLSAAKVDFYQRERDWLDGKIDYLTEDMDLGAE